MKRLAIKVIVALLTFSIGIFLTTAGTRRQAVPATPDKPACIPFPFFQTTQFKAPTVKEYRISQEETIEFAQLGKVRIIANESFGENLHLEFTEAESNKNLLSVTFYGNLDDMFKPTPEFKYTNPKLRFKVISIKGIPNPLVIAMAMAPGGSDCFWEAAAIGAVDGKLKELTTERLTTAEQGGFFFGNLGRGRGPGAAVWKFIWADDEGHGGSHQYEVKLYTWNKAGGRFEWNRVFRTKGKFDSGEAALHGSNLHFVDIRDSFDFDLGEE